MLGQAIGNAVCSGIDTLTRELGLPKFVGQIAKNVVQQWLPHQTKSCEPECAKYLQDTVGHHFKRFEKEVCSDFVESFKHHQCEHEKSAGAGSKGKSWFVALMQALGDLQNKQAEKVQKLGKEVSDELGANKGSSSGQPSQAQFDKQEELKAEGKLLEVLANVTKSIGDAIGNALSTAARAQ
jgi:hypothetical protein